MMCHSSLDVFLSVMICVSAVLAWERVLWPKIQEMRDAE